MIASCSHGNCAPTWGTTWTDTQIHWASSHPSCWEYLVSSNFECQSHVLQNGLHSSKLVCVHYIYINAHTCVYSYVNKTTWLTIYYISGDSKEEASRKYLQHAATAYRVSEDTAVRPFFTCTYISRYALGQSGDTKTPDILQTRGEAMQCVTSLMNSVAQISMQS